MHQVFGLLPSLSFWVLLSLVFTIFELLNCIFSIYKASTTVSWQPCNASDVNCMYNINALPNDMDEDVDAD